MQNERKPYVKPAVVREVELETRAGSPASIVDPSGIETIGGE